LVKENSRPIIITIVILILGLPLVFLLFSTTPYWSGGKMSPAEKISQLEEGVKSSPTFDNYLNLGLAYLNNSQPEKSLDPLAKARDLRPDSAVIYNNLGVAYNLLKRYDEGIAACRQAIRLDPTFQLAKNNLKWGLDEKKKLQGR
jgi:tetratricopeptide (TPR) repeat protein